MKKGSDVDALEAEVAALRQLRFHELKARYERLTGESAPLSISPRVLLLAVSYEVQREWHRARRAFDGRRAGGGCTGRGQ